MHDIVLAGFNFAGVDRHGSAGIDDDDLAALQPVDDGGSGIEPDAEEGVRGIDRLLPLFRIQRIGVQNIGARISQDLPGLFGN